MSLIKEIEVELRLVAALPDEWQRYIALLVSRVVVAYDNTLTKTPNDQQESLDRELLEFRQRFEID